MPEIGILKCSHLKYIILYFCLASFLFVSRKRLVHCHSTVEVPSSSNSHTSSSFSFNRNVGIPKKSESDSAGANLKDMVPFVGLLASWILLTNAENGIYAYFSYFCPSTIDVLPLARCRKRCTCLYELMMG